MLIFCFWGGAAALDTSVGVMSHQPVYEETPAGQEPVVTSVEVG